VYVRVRVRVRVRMWVWVCVCVRACVYMCMRVCITYVVCMIIFFYRETSGQYCFSATAASAIVIFCFHAFNSNPISSRVEKYTFAIPYLYIYIYSITSVDVFVDSRGA